MPATADGMAHVAYVRGVESPLPAGERVLWQGAPDWRALARHTFHVRKVLVYFGALTVLSAVFARQGPTPWEQFSRAALWLAISATTAIGFAVVIAALTTRATTYAITTRRVVMRTGIALPVVLNIPLRLIEAVDARERAGGSGDIAIRLGADVRVAYLVLWPHVRAWRLRHPEPLLRGLSAHALVGRILHDALIAESERSACAPVAVPESEGYQSPAREPAGFAA
ncbi:MAG: photosynthetic complex putative assembly protein PuhB [bacterium]